MRVCMTSWEKYRPRGVGANHIESSEHLAKMLNEILVSLSTEEAGEQFLDCCTHFSDYKNQRELAYALSFLYQVDPFKAVFLIKYLWRAEQGSDTVFNIYRYLQDSCMHSAFYVMGVLCGADHRHHAKNGWSLLMALVDEEITFSIFQNLMSYARYDVPARTLVGMYESDSQQTQGLFRKLLQEKPQVAYQCLALVRRNEVVFKGLFTALLGYITVSEIDKLIMTYVETYHGKGNIKERQQAYLGVVGLVKRCFSQEGDEEELYDYIFGQSVHLMQEEPPFFFSHAKRCNKQSKAMLQLKKILGCEVPEDAKMIKLEPRSFSSSS